VALVDVNGAQLWVEAEGDGPAVLFVHGGLGDSRLWEPQARALDFERRELSVASLDARSHLGKRLHDPLHGTA
jgi:pimeloyl-ACP methyl ester carboxylesterase